MNNKRITLINLCCLTEFPFIDASFDANTYYELLCKVVEQLNKTITQVNALTEVVSNIDINFDEINAKIDKINSDISQLKIDMSNLSTNINKEVDAKLQAQYNQVVQLMSDYQTIFNTNLQTLEEKLESEISRIELGDVKAYNPTNGKIENVSKVIQDVYDVSRVNALTASEFDALNLTVEAFQAYNITCLNFDINGKTILV